MAFIDFCLEKNLLKEDENGIYSIRMQQHKAARRLLSNKGKEGSKKRWEQAKKIAPPLAYKGKERKGKEINNISKDISPAPPAGGNIEINKMLEALKTKIGISAFVDSSIERNMAKHCCGLMGKIGKDEFVRRLDALLADNFHSKNCNKIKYIYNNIKGFIQPQTQSRVAKIIY